MKPPDGFEELQQAFGKPAESIFNAMGVVSDFLPATKTKGTDLVITFKLTDPTWEVGEGLKCRFFGQTEAQMPTISSKGDVVVLRSVRLKEFNGERIALSFFGSSWLVFHQQDIPTDGTKAKEPLPVSKPSDQDASPGQDIVDYAIKLCNSRDRSTFDEPPPITSLQAGNILDPGAAKNKFQLIQDLTLPRTPRDLKFADLLGEVRKVYSNDFRVDLSITDYTSHESLYNYVHSLDADQAGRDGDTYNYIPGPKSWPGPWGKMSIVVAAWDAHATFAREHVAVGTLVFLRNVQISLDKEGARMEGKLRGDRYQQDRIGISIYKPQQVRDDDRLKALLKRKRDYEAELKLHGIKGLEESKKLKDEARLLSAEKHEKHDKPQTQAEKKKKRKEKKKERQKAKSNPPQPPTSHTLNPNIRTNKVPDSTLPVHISDVLHSSVLTFDFPTQSGNQIHAPFKNNLYHLRPIRVIDFHPPNLADFAAPHLITDYSYLSDHESDDSSSSRCMDLDPTSTTTIEWEWRFSLLVEDASTTTTLSSPPRARIPLLISGSDADFLLRSVRATDLRRDPASLARLREKLFLLWGDLLERKEEEQQQQQQEQEQEQREQRVSEAPAQGEESVKQPQQQDLLLPSGRPFECLVKEYGVPVRKGAGWQRVFAMFGTSIVSD